MEAAARDLLAGMSSTFKARNGREVGIEADDGEKCWIVHSDLITALEATLAASPTPPTAQPGEVERLREARDAVLALAASVVRGVAAEKRNQGERQSALNYAARRIEDLRARAILTPSESGEAGPQWTCTRCGRDEIDARANGCTRGPCPMVPR
jgi:hypothetical protein